jgi:hypothetical protein
MRKSRLSQFHSDILVGQAQGKIAFVIPPANNSLPLTDAPELN